MSVERVFLRQSCSRQCKGPSDTSQIEQQVDDFIDGTSIINCWTIYDRRWYLNCLCTCYYGYGIQIGILSWRIRRYKSVMMKCHGAWCRAGGGRGGMRWKRLTVTNQSATDRGGVHYDSGIATSRRDDDVPARRIAYWSWWKYCAAGRCHCTAMRRDQHLALGLYKVPCRAVGGVRRGSLGAYLRRRGC